MPGACVFYFDMYIEHGTLRESLFWQTLAASSAVAACCLLRETLKRRFNRRNREKP
jgi:hypothetical protein